MTPHRPQDLPFRQSRNFSLGKALIALLILAIIGFWIADWQQDKSRTDRYNAEVATLNELSGLIRDSIVKYNALIDEQNELESHNSPRYAEIEDQLRMLEKDIERLDAKYSQHSSYLKTFD